MSSFVGYLFSFLSDVVRDFLNLWLKKDEEVDKSLLSIVDETKEFKVSNYEKVREYNGDFKDVISFTENKDTLSSKQDYYIDTPNGILPAPEVCYNCTSCGNGTCPIDSNEDSVTNSGNTYNEDNSIHLDPKLNIGSCLYNYDEEVRVKVGVDGIATRYYGRKGIIKSIIAVGSEGKYKLGLKIHDRVKLLYVWEDSVKMVE